MSGVGAFSREPERPVGEFNVTLFFPNRYPYIWRSCMMVRLVPAVSSVIVSLCFPLLFSGCSPQDRADGDLPELYQKAAVLADKGEYQKAIALYDKALAVDTLTGFSGRAVLELYKKRHLEGLVGEYGAALRSADLLERCSGKLLPDSLRAMMLAEKASWLSELGLFQDAEKVLASVSRPSENQQFDLAAFALRNGGIERAVGIYRRYAAAEEDPVARMRGLAGLLQCRMRKVVSGDKVADNLAMSLAALSGKVLALKGDHTRRIQALRESARSLQLLEKHRRNASYLLFRALIIAEQSKNPFLIQLLRHESNAVIVEKPQPYRESGDFFDMKNLQFAEVASRLRFATADKELSDIERIDALRRGLLLYQNYQPRYPGAEMEQLVADAKRRLVGMLVRKERIFELFDALQQFEMLELQGSLRNGSGYLNLGKEHEALQKQVLVLKRDVSGLLQRKANIFLDGRNYALNHPAEIALQLKRGKLLELLDEVKKVDPSAAAVLQINPVTLPTLQRLLKSDQLLLKPVVADSFYAVMTITNRAFGIAGVPVPLDSSCAPDARLRRFTETIAAQPFSGFDTIRHQPDAAWFSRAFAGSLNARSGKYRHLLVAADPAVPVHVFGFGGTVAAEKKISMVASFREIVHESMHSGTERNMIPLKFYPAEQIRSAQLYMLFHPGAQVFLLWKPFGTTEQSRMRQALLRDDVAELSASGRILHFVRSSSGQAEKDTWMCVSAYGIR